MHVIWSLDTINKLLKYLRDHICLGTISTSFMGLMTDNVCASQQVPPFANHCGMEFEYIILSYGWVKVDM